MLEAFQGHTSSQKGSKLEMQNYRPVAIILPFSKVLERVMHEHIYSYFSKNRIFHQNLHGYRHNHSTETALVSMYDKWIRAAAEKNVSGVVLLDLSATFDLVEPKLLVKKLQIYGIQDDILCWIESYFTDRYQAVWINHTLSEFRLCEVGVPQGSILGPLLFLIFFNDLAFSLDCEVESYADDTTLSVAGS